MTATKKWYEEWELVTHVVDSHTTFKALCLPNAMGRKLFTVEVNKNLDPTMDQLLQIVESLLFEITDKKEK